MIDNTLNSRIKIDPLYDGLNMYYIDTELDNFGSMIEKINNNFKEIGNSGGGPMGPPGPQGEAGCPGEPGEPGPPGESDLNWIGANTIMCSSVAAINYNEIDGAIITNKNSGKSMLLSNLYKSIDSNDYFPNVDNIDIETYLKYPGDYNDYKLKILNSDKFSNGRHIHLMNSKATEFNSNLMCGSGFTISNDFVGNNYELLRIKSEKNIEVPEHKLDIELSSNKLFIGKTPNSQKFFFDLKDDVDSLFFNGFLVDTQTKENEIQVPDRSGYLPVWEDTLERGENWEIITNEDIKIYSASYMNSNWDLPIVNVNIEEEQWVEILSNSYIRFKRMNNWVLIDFHIAIQRKNTLEVSHDNFTLKNIVFLVNKETLRCRTTGWHTSTVMENEFLNDNSDDINSFGFYKIDGTSTENDSLASFSILNKFHYNIYNIVFDSTRTDRADHYWISGQVWATVSTEDEVCEILQIDQCMECPPLIISEQN